MIFYIRDIFCIYKSLEIWAEFPVSVAASYSERRISCVFHYAVEVVGGGKADGICVHCCVIL